MLIQFLCNQLTKLLQFNQSKSKVLLYQRQQYICLLFQFIEQINLQKVAMIPEQPQYSQKKQKKLLLKKRRKANSFMQSFASERSSKLYENFDSFYLQENEDTQTAKETLKNQGQMDKSYDQQYYKSQRLKQKPINLSFSRRKNIQGWVEQVIDNNWHCQQQDQNQNDSKNNKLITHSKNQKSYLLNYVHNRQLKYQNFTEPKEMRKKSLKSEMKATVVIINDAPQNKKTNCVLNGRIIKIKQKINKIKHVSLPKKNVINDFGHSNYVNAAPLHSLSFSTLNFIIEPDQKARIMKYKFHQPNPKKLQNQLLNMCRYTKSELKISQNSQQLTLQKIKKKTKNINSNQKQIKNKIKLKVKQRIQSQESAVNNLKLQQLIKAQNFKCLSQKKPQKKSHYRSPTLNIRQMVESYINRNIKVNDDSNQNLKNDMKYLLSRQNYNKCKNEKTSTTYYPKIENNQPGLSEAVKKTIKTILDFKQTRDHLQTQ